MRVCAVDSAGLELTARSTRPAPPSRRRGRRPAGLWLTSGAGMARGPEPGPSLSSPPLPFVPQPLWPPGRIHALSDSDLKESDSLLCPRRQTLGFYFISLVGGCVYECVCVCVCVRERERERERPIVPSSSPRGGWFSGSPADRWPVGPLLHRRDPPNSTPARPQVDSAFESASRGPAGRGGWAWREGRRTLAAAPS